MNREGEEALRRACKGISSMCMDPGEIQVCIGVCYLTHIDFQAPWSYKKTEKVVPLRVPL